MATIDSTDSALTDLLQADITITDACVFFYQKNYFSNWSRLLYATAEALVQARNGSHNSIKTRKTIAGIKSSVDLKLYRIKNILYYINNPEGRSENESRFFR